MDRKSERVFVGLFAFGVVYNAVISWLERHGYERGYTSLLVVFGTVVTLLGSAILVGVRRAVMVCACFISSGLPMIAGSMWRYMRQRERDFLGMLNDLEELNG